ncbi:MAG: hypothetical protein DRO01_03530 [Thermoproteota archaeon]|nr:MAG: hypothetical protein DRO01_03530 [Candidatus Korarchaeota archaeon]
MKWHRLPDHIPKVFVYKDLDGYISVYARTLEEAWEILEKRGLLKPWVTFVGLLAVPIPEKYHPPHIKLLREIGKPPKPPKPRIKEMGI